MKWIFSILFLLSIALFALMQWGGALTGSVRNAQGLAELNPEKILLLDALPAPEIPSLSVPLPVPVTAATPNGKTTAIKTCMEWGEFSGTDLARAENELGKMKLGDRLAQRTVEYASGYWVYIPPLRNKDALNKKIAEIKTIGVEDFYVVKDPKDWYNAISLGVFKTEESAKNFLAILKKKGIRTAKVSERKHKLKFAVFLINNADTELATHLTTLQKDYINSELKHVPCNN